MLKLFKQNIISQAGESVTHKFKPENTYIKFYFRRPTDDNFKPSDDVLIDPIMGPFPDTYEQFREVNRPIVAVQFKWDYIKGPEGNPTKHEGFLHIDGLIRNQLGIILTSRINGERVLGGGGVRLNDYALGRKGERVGLKPDPNEETIDQLFNHLDGYVPSELANMLLPMDFYFNTCQLVGERPRLVEQQMLLEIDRENGYTLTTELP